MSGSRTGASFGRHCFSCPRITPMSTIDTWWPPHCGNPSVLHWVRTCLDRPRETGVSHDIFAYFISLFPGYRFICLLWLISSTVLLMCVVVSEGCAFFSVQVRRLHSLLYSLTCYLFSFSYSTIAHYTCDFMVFRSFVFKISHCCALVSGGSLSTAFACRCLLLRIVRSSLSLEWVGYVKVA